MRLSLFLIAVLPFALAVELRAADSIDLEANAKIDTIAMEARAKALQLKDEGRYEEADRIYQEAFERMKDYKGYKESAEYKALKLNWCELCLRRGMYSTANDTLDAFDPKDKNSHRWNRRKASALTYLGHYKDAREIYNKFIEKDFPIPKDDNLWDIHSNIGFIYAQTGDHKQAVKYMSQALDILEKKAPADQRNFNTVLSNLAIEEGKLRDFEKADKDIESALKYFRSTGGENHPVYIITLRKKAEILMMKDKISEATDIFIDYVEKERAQAVKEFALFTEQKRLDYWKNKRPLISEIFQTEDERPSALFDVSVFRREVSLLGGADSIDIPRRLKLRGEDIRRSLKKGEVAVDYIKYSNKDTIDTYAALVAYPIKDARGVQFVPLWTERELNGYRIGYKTLKEAVCSRLTSDKDAVYGDSALAKKIWNPLKKHLSDASDIYFCPDGLLNMLAIEYLPIDSIKGKLHRLTSFSKITSRGGERRARKRMLAVGGLDYNESVKEADGNGKVNHDAIDYLHKKVGGGRIFSYLSGTREEIAAIDSCVKQSLALDTLALDTAYVKSEAELKRDLADKKYSSVHLSTHGYSLSVDVAEQSEMYRDSIEEDRSLIASGIALSGANVAYKKANSEDGVLSARELCNMNLKHIDLVVLSACQTALGEVSDEGPAGLVRGLKKSGANTVIATLWEVDDQATQLLMTAFYKNLAANPNMTKAEALSLAQDSLKNYKVMAVSAFNPATLTSTVEYVEYKGGKGTPVTPYKAPYYWAPFIVIDDYIKK